MNDYIVIISLSNGLELVAVIIDEDDKLIEVEYPFYITYNYKTGNAILRPFTMFSSEHNYRIRADNVISISKASEDVAEHYLKVTDQYSSYLENKFMVDDLLDSNYYSMDEEQPEEEPDSLYVEGTQTKH